MEKITLPLKIKEVDSDQSENFTFKGHLAAFNNVDHDGDVIKKGAFAEWLMESKEQKKESIPVFWSHHSSEPIGIFPLSDMVEDDKGLFVKGILPKDDTFVSGRVIPQMRIGSVSKMSIGYRIRDFEYDGDIRTLKSLSLWEGSLVALPANEDASVTSFKTVTPFEDLPLDGREKRWDADAALGRVQEWAGILQNDDLSDPDAQLKYRKAFFFFNAEDADLFGAYKLPFADIVDGTLKAVPRGIFAAAAAVNGARGGVYLPSYERPAVMRNIERYYDKMGLESPFGKSFRLDDFNIDERSLEKIFREGARFSGKMAKAVVSAIKQAGLREVMSPLSRDAEQAQILEAMDNVLNKIKRR